MSLQILTKDQLREGGKPGTAELPLPEIGEGMGVVVKGYTLGEILLIQRMSNQAGPDGVMVYDAKQDHLLSIITALADPKITIEDADWVAGLSPGVAQKIIDTASRLGHRNVSDFERLKEHLRDNPLVRRIYQACAEVFHCLPSQMAEVPESEFMAALAAMELKAEEIAEEMSAATKTEG